MMRNVAAAGLFSREAVICLLCCWLLLPSAVSASSIAQLQAQAREASDENQKKMDEQIAQLRERRNEAQERLKEFQNSSDQAWDQMVREVILRDNVQDHYSVNGVWRDTLSRNMPSYRYRDETDGHRADDDLPFVECHTRAGLCGSGALRRTAREGVGQTAARK